MLTWITVKIKNYFYAKSDDMCTTIWIFFFFFEEQFLSKLGSQNQFMLVNHWLKSLLQPCEKDRNFLQTSIWLLRNLRKTMETMVLNICFVIFPCFQNLKVFFYCAWDNWAIDLQYDCVRFIYIYIYIYWISVRFILK